MTAHKFPLRLPDGWVVLAPVENVQVAALPRGDGEHPFGVLTVTAAHEDTNDTDPQVAAWREAGVLVLDEERARCRGGVPARRMLTAHTQNGRALTSEVWCVAGDRPAVLCAVVETPRYAELGPGIRRALRSYPR